MVPSYKDTQWQVVQRPSEPGMLQIRVLENGEQTDYWVPEDPANTDYQQFQNWLLEGNQVRQVF